MPYVQKEEGLGAYNSSVQINDDMEFELVPQLPNLLEVNMPFLQFHTPDVRIPNPQNNVVYMVALVDGQLVIETVPMDNDAP